MIKKHWSIMLFVVVVVFSVVRLYGTENQQSPLTIQTIPVAGGWGYNVLLQGKIYIHQPAIPAITGNKAFATAAEAKTIATLVTQKLQQHKPPTIQVAELDSCHIAY